MHPTIFSERQEFRISLHISVAHEIIPSRAVILPGRNARERFNCIWRDATRNDQKNETPLFSPDEPAPGVFRALVTFDLLRLSHAFRVLLWHFAAYELLCGDMKKRSEKKNRKYDAILLLLSLFGSLRFVPIMSSLLFLASFFLLFICVLPSFLPLPISLSPDFTISFLLSRSLYLSLYLAHSPYSLRFHRDLLSFLLPFARSLQPYLVTHKRPACNSSGVRISQRTACFCHVRVTTASRTRAW